MVRIDFIQPLSKVGVTGGLLNTMQSPQIGTGNVAVLILVEL